MIICKLINFSYNRMYRNFFFKIGNLLYGNSHKFFQGFDPKKSFEKAVQYLKKLRSNKGDEDPNMNRYKIGVGLYLAACLGIYELKRQRSILITHQQTIEAIKKSEANVIYVVKEKYESGEQGKKGEEGKNYGSSFRKIYFKIDGVEHVTYVPQIDLFYNKLKQIEKNKTTQKVKIIEKEETVFDYQMKRFFSSVNKVILPLIFPILLFNSSIGKVFKTKVLGQNEGYRPNIKFKDIAGLGNSKVQISELVDFLKNPAKYKKIGAKIPKGALLSGPPGTGKTMLAKACAGQADVPFFSVSGSEFVELYAGMGATRVRDLFRNAKKQTPAIIFIDQIDAIGRKRDDKFGGAHDERANTLNQLLVQMDGFGTADDIIILAATNRKEMLDNALTRPGRFDRLVQIQLPDIKGRQEILELYLNKIKLSPKQSLVDYARRLATLTYGFSGADLANLCNQSAILAVRKNRQFVEPQDFEQASDRVLAGLEQTLNLDESEKKKIAYHQAGHAVVAWFSEGASPLLKITIVPRSRGSLGFAQYLPNESTLMNKRQLFDQICVILGGRISEQHFFKEISSGAADDLQKVRNIARSMVVRFGMSQNFPNYAPVDTEGHNIYSEETSTKIDQEIIKIIDKCTKQTRKTVKLYKDKIQALASEVLKKESLNHQQIKAILGERPFEVKENYRQFLQNVQQPKRADAVV